MDRKTKRSLPPNRVGISAALFAAVLAAGCVAGAAAPALADEPVKVGVLTDMSGVYADTAGKGSVLAAQMAVDDAGPVLGQKAVVVSADHQNKPDVGASIARQWYDVDHVDMITDLTNSGVALAVQALTRDKNKVDMVSGGGSSEITNGQCSPNGIHWTYDTYALSVGSATALVKEGKKSWFFITADYAFGQQLERDAGATVKSLGGTVLGGVRAPLSTPDFSSFLLQAQGSKAQVIGLANAGADTSNSIKQASEFGIIAGGQTLVGLLSFITDIDSIGLKTAGGLVLTNSFYWDMNDEARAWSKKYFAVQHKMPTMTQAGVYGATLFYLHAIQAVGTRDTAKVVAKMHDTPINDFMTKDGHIRADGRVEREFYLQQVKKPEQSKYPWDYYTTLRTIPRGEAIRPAAQSVCKLLTKS